MAIAEVRKNGSSKCVSLWAASQFPDIKSWDKFYLFVYRDKLETFLSAHTSCVVFLNLFNPKSKIILLAFSFFFSPALCSFLTKLVLTWVLLRWGEEVGILTERLQTRLYVTGKIQIGFLATLFSTKKDCWFLLWQRSWSLRGRLFCHRFLSGCRSARCFRAQWGIYICKRKRKSSRKHPFLFLLLPSVSMAAKRF